VIKDRPLPFTDFAVERLSLLLHTRQISGSNLAEQTGHSDLGLWFSSDLQADAGRVRQILPQTIPSTSFPVVIHRATSQSTLYDLNCRKGR
jgi:hypothetical protein